jgi:hypothetical protein
MREVGFPIERDPAEAWPHFIGWRVNYERAAYAVAATVYAVPALWSVLERLVCTLHEEQATVHCTLPEGQRLGVFG